MFKTVDIFEQVKVH